RVAVARPRHAALPAVVVRRAAHVATAARGAARRSFAIISTVMSDENGAPSDLIPEPEEEIKRLREALEAKTREAEALHERSLRTMAEFDNARKRAAREREDHIRFANESLLRELLPALDNFDRALQAARGEPAAAPVVAGVELIQREIIRVLEKFG